MQKPGVFFYGGAIWPKTGHFFDRKGLTRPRPTQNGRNKGGEALVTPSGDFWTYQHGVNSPSGCSMGLRLNSGKKNVPFGPHESPLVKHRCSPLWFSRCFGHVIVTRSSGRGARIKNLREISYGNLSQIGRLSLIRLSTRMHLQYALCV